MEGTSSTLERSEIETILQLTYRRTGLTKAKVGSPPVYGLRHVDNGGCSGTNTHLKQNQSTCPLPGKEGGDELFDDDNSDDGFIVLVPGLTPSSR
jgi:hypothetical protein